jgi:hypothetical protein
VKGASDKQKIPLFLNYFFGSIRREEKKAVWGRGSAKLKKGQTSTVLEKVLLDSSTSPVVSDVRHDNSKSH